MESNTNSEEFKKIRKEIIDMFRYNGMNIIKIKNWKIK